MLKYPNTIVVNFLAGPSAGKSTMASSLFSKLKWDGIDCELAAEYAKDLVWEKRTKTFENQIYLFGKQHHRIFRLLGQVQVVVAECPILLTPIYDRENRETLKRLVLEEFNKCNNINFFILREKKYNPNGRIHSKKQSDEIDLKIESLLKENLINFTKVPGNSLGVQFIKNVVKSRLKIL